MNKNIFNVEIAYELDLWDVDWNGSDNYDKNIDNYCANRDYYLHIIDLCFNYAQFFSLSDVGWKKKYDYTVMKKLNPYLIMQKNVTKWFGWIHHTSRVYVYKCTSETKNILLESFDNIFLQIKVDKHYSLSNCNLEDLCFFKDNKLFFGSVSHESICGIFPPTEEFKRAMEQFGKWKSCSPNKFWCIPRL